MGVISYNDNEKINFKRVDVDWEDFIHMNHDDQLEVLQKHDEWIHQINNRADEKYEKLEQKLVEENNKWNEILKAREDENKIRIMEERYKGNSAEIIAIKGDITDQNKRSKSVTVEMEIETRADEELGCMVSRLIKTNGARVVLRSYED